MTDALAQFSTRKTAQTQRADPRQVRNAAGGYVFQIDDRARLRRFLTIGTAAGTYYVNAKDLTVENAEVVIKMAQTDGAYLVQEIVDISTAGRAPKQNPAIFALAIASALGDDATRRAAFEALPLVCRIGTHLFLFARYREQFGGWGRGAVRAVSRWYAEKDLNDLAYQVVKYRQREGATHRDLLRLSHPGRLTGKLAPTDARRSLYDWVCGRPAELAGLPMIEGFVKANEPGANVGQLVRDYRLPWEALPDEALGRSDVWGALLDNGMPMTALMRQLPRLTRLGVLPAMGGRTSEVVSQLTDGEHLRKSRVHPMAILIAHKTYAEGHSLRGSTSWTPTTKIIDALDAAFYASYGNVTPTGKRTMLALDVSGSMGFSNVSENVPITPREASAAIALVTANVEPNHVIVGFTGGDDLTDLPISPRQRLGDAVRTISNLRMGMTDCSLPWVVAKRRKLEIDGAVIYTDNETWAGKIHPHQALVEYRRASGIAARSVVAAMTSTGFSIADPNDAGSLDCVGLDAAVPQLIADFIAGV